MGSPSVIDQLGELAGFLGTWRGEGRGRWGDARFEYLEQLEFVHGGKPQVAYRQRTRAGDDGRPLHAEDGFWRVPGDGSVELVLAQGIGIVEICRATWEGGVLVARASVLRGSPSAKTVTDVERTYRVDGHSLDFSMRMATDGGDLRPHLDATLVRAQ